MRVSLAVTLLGMVMGVCSYIPEVPPRFDITGDAYDLFRSKPLAGVYIQQSFTFDNVNRRLFVIQRKDGAATDSGDMTISELDFSGNLLASMHLLACGHGLSIGAQAVGSDTYLWTETDVAPGGYGQRLWRFKFENGKTLSSKTDTRARIIPIPDMIRATATIDSDHNNLIVRYQVGNVRNIAVFDLDEATAGNFSNPLADWPIATDLGFIVDFFQGYAAYGRYIYFLNGRSYDATGGVVDSELMSLDLQTGKIVQAPAITRAGSTLTYREPEGMAVYTTVAGEPRLFLGFASGAAGDRRSNIFYKNKLF